MNKKPVCVCVAQRQKKQTKKFVWRSFVFMSANGEIHEAYNLYIIKNTVTILPSGNFTKEINSS